MSFHGGRRQLTHVRPIIRTINYEKMLFTDGKHMGMMPLDWSFYQRVWRVNYSFGTGHSFATEMDKLPIFLRLDQRLYFFERLLSPVYIHCNLMYHRYIASRLPLLFPLQKQVHLFANRSLFTLSILSIHSFSIFHYRYTTVFKFPWQF